MTEKNNTLFKEVPVVDQFPAMEREILSYWQDHRIFEKSIQSRPIDRPFVFYEGPPTANGKPGIHHVLARSIKDFFCRYKTMGGYRVERKGGWDTHGLPVEIEVEKSLKISGKKDIEALGVETFNKKCYESVWTYKELWDQLTDRMGYWIDLKRPYVTCENDYIESVWWVLKQFFEKDLIYKGFKVVPYCPRCGTPLSSHEVAQGYQDVKDPSVYVRFRLPDETDTSFLVWTTTPWTLISNVALAVGPDIDYVKIRWENEFLILAEARLPALFKDGYEIVSRMKGSDLLGRPYTRLFDYVPVDKKAFFVIGGDFVTTDDGSGIVHTAPAFGEDDYRVCKQNGLPFIRPVDAAGRFEDIISDFKGLFVKDADPEIITDLKRRGLLFRSEKFIHSYPHCWRHRTPLIYYARDAWYIRTTDFKDRMVANNRSVNWFPPEIQQGRFGNWLENNIDWSLSRDRYWGTPLPIWIDEESGDMLCVGSRAELEMGRMKTGAPVPPDLDLHKPYVDNVVFEKSGKRYVRTPEVIDVWFDSGAMPVAQWHYPFENREIFERQYPADFICEGVDQTRGWFYSLMAISTFLFDRSPYRNVVVNELVLDAQGRKMSKSLGNVVDPFQMLDQHGADVLRWYILVNTPVSMPKRFDADGLIEMKKKFFRPLLETYKFFAMYANIDGFDNSSPPVPLTERSELDRWILSRLHSLLMDVGQLLDEYDCTKAGKKIQEFVDDDLSNWYIRLSRRRFWKGEKGPDKTAAYQTLYEILFSLSRLIAPYCPFVAERLYKNLTAVLPENQRTESVHLADFPAAKADVRNIELENKMDAPRRVVKLGRALRELKGLKTRQPLAKIVLVTDDAFKRQTVESFKDIIRSELNVKTIDYLTDSSDVVTRTVKPNFKALGPRVGKKMNAVAAAIRELTEDDARKLMSNDRLRLSVNGDSIDIAREDVEIEHKEKTGLAVESDGDLTVALDTQLTDGLIEEGLAREFVNRIQNLRKEAGLEVIERIRIAVDARDMLAKAITNQMDYIKTETLAVDVALRYEGGSFEKTVEINDEPVRVSVQPAH